MPKRTSSILSNLIARLRGGLKPPARLREPVRPFQAISIYRGIQCCCMAKKFSEHRFLAKDAPALPLSGCTMPQGCECRYIKHRDRRGGQRRLVDFGVADGLYLGAERRRFNSRRQE